MYIIFGVTGLPQTGAYLFCRKITVPKTSATFLQRGEEVRRKGRGIGRTSLPHPHDYVSLFIHNFINCEGCFAIVCNYRFHLLTHLLIEQLLNFPYCFLKYLQHLAQAMRIAKHPKSFLTNHALIKLIIIHSLQQHGSTWTSLLPKSLAPAAETEESETEE